MDQRYDYGACLILQITGQAACPLNDYTASCSYKWNIKYLDLYDSTMDNRYPRTRPILSFVQSENDGNERRRRVPTGRKPHRMRAGMP